MSSKKKSSSEEFQEKLNKFNKSKMRTPSSAIMDTIDDKQSNSNTKKTEDESNVLSNLIKEKARMEDTHTRRTFLVKNELLKKLDKVANSTNNRGFKTEFINYVIEKGLDEISDLQEER